MKKENGTVNILLVDDDAGNLLALEAILEGLGQNLVKAASGREALLHLLKDDFAVILLDVQMADMDGIETATIIRERAQSNHIPIIFLTGTVQPSEVMFKGYSTGAVDYLMKPVVEGILRAKVSVFVELGLARKQLQEESAKRAEIARELSQLNATLEQKNQDLTSANADLETFTYSVSHDLRAPLRHIQAYVSLLKKSLESKLEPPELKQIEKITMVTARMGGLIDDLLNFAKTGRAEIRPWEVDMDLLVRDTIGQFQPDLANRQVEWKISALPKVRGDYNLLRQVWMNLIGNAIKFTSSRAQAVIEVGTLDHEKDLVFYIRDNGVGFKMKYVDKLFGVFQRLHHNEEFEGTGIGLANVRKIVQRHSGGVWGEGQEGVGACFYFSLPRAV